MITLDPTKTLDDIREAIELYEDPANIDDERVHYANEFIERFEALDKWLSNGGFHPSDWKA